MVTLRPRGEPHSGRLRRLAEVAAAVALWMGLGWAFGITGNGYLLLGVPITAAFQIWVRRRPLHTAWVRDAPAFRLDRAGVFLAAILAALPAYALVRFAAGPRSVEWTLLVWLLAAVVGAVGAAFAFRSFGRTTLRHLAGCLATAGGVGVAIFAAARVAAFKDEPLTARATAEGLRWFLLYLPAAFVLEEVFFRGVADAHVHRDGESLGVATAVFVAVLWGLWHLPGVFAGTPLLAAALGLVVVHVMIGVPLAIYWRRSGNLAVPATVHALVNGVRNALELYP